LRIKVLPGYPREVPLIWELDGEIPRKPEFHINPDDSFCLGSPLRLKVILSRDSRFDDFIKECLHPFLYAVTHKLKLGGDFIFGELEHGNKGEIADYMQLLNVKDSAAVLKSLRALSQKKRVSNKHPCPCGCENRLGVCDLHNTINQFRNVVPRCDYAERYKALVN